MWYFSHTWTFQIRRYMLLPLFHNLSILDNTYTSTLLWKMKNLVYLHCLSPSLPNSTPSVNFVDYIFKCIYFMTLNMTNKLCFWTFNFNQYLLTLYYEMWDNYSIYLFFFSTFLSLLHPSSNGCCCYFKLSKFITFTLCSITLILNVPSFTHVLMHKLWINSICITMLMQLLFNEESNSVVSSTEKER